MARESAAVRAAIVKLSDRVGDIAFRCHEQLGTVDSARIQHEMNVLGEAFHDRPALGLRCRLGWHSWYLDGGCADRCRRCLRWRTS